PLVTSCWFKDDRSQAACPGPFSMFGLPGVDEIPMSVLAIHGRSDGGLVIKKGGEISQTLFEKKAGDQLWLRGPYGRPFDPEAYDKLLLVGGGTGLVPLISLMGQISDREITLVTGARTDA